MFLLQAAQKYFFAVNNSSEVSAYVLYNFVFALKFFDSSEVGSFVVVT